MSSPALVAAPVSAHDGRFWVAALVVLAADAFCVNAASHFHEVVPSGAFTAWLPVSGGFVARSAELADSAVKGVIAGALVWLVLFNASLLKSRTAFFGAGHGRPAPRSGWLWHGAALLAFVVMRGVLAGRLRSPVDLGELALIALYLTSFALFALSAARLVGPLGFWRGCLRDHGMHLVLMVAVAAGSALLIKVGFDSEAWRVRYHALLFPPTAAGIADLLRWWGYAVQVDAAAQTVTVGDFEVTIAAQCLGYEGLSIASLVVVTYLYARRAAFRFPQVLLVLPLVLAAMFVGNLLRIALLVAIGASWSPDIAVFGFHSVSGWINLSAVLTLAFMAIHRIPFFTRHPSRFAFDLSDEKVQLVPQLVLMAVALLSLLVSPAFEWLYPLRVVVVGVVIWALWPGLALEKISRMGLPVLVGAAVFVLWIALVPDDPAKSALFADQLFSVAPWWTVTWLAFRLVGAMVVVPLAEELAFRGHVFRLVQDAAANGFGDAQKTRRAQLMALVITSIAFGLLHSAWIAGTLAGLGYGLLKLYRGRVVDAVVAHAVTNLLLAGYVLHTQRWSLW